MSQIVWVAVYPFLLLSSIPLMIFAFLTTAAAISTLLFRVLLVYADLAAVLIGSRVSHHQSSKPTSALWRTSGSHASTKRRARRKSSSSSSSGDPNNTFGGSRTPKSTESSGLGAYSAGSMQRDFEGVGGWRIPNTEGEDISWTSMNARLELPAFGKGRQRHHRRSITSSCMLSSMRTRPSELHIGEIPRTSRSPGTTSPREYFVNRRASRSTTALGTANLSQMHHWHD